MSDVAIRVEGLGKKYRIAHRRPHDSLKEAIMDGLRRKRGRANADPTRADEEFWALKDVSFEVKRGEVLGVIGRNGAGKSTLLKILSRIVEMTTGTIDIRGRVGSLLEVGTGFHPELTGRENIYLNGAILGMKRDEIRRQFDEIVAFSEIEKFLDTPVKRYSSGMYTRLAFAVAAHLEPEILIVDEVLAVGDAQFQKKCLGKMGDAAKAGRTLLFVSHNLVALSSLCESAIWIEKGRVCDFGPSGPVVANYNRHAMSQLINQRQWSEGEQSPGDNGIHMRQVSATPATTEGTPDNSSENIGVITTLTPLDLRFDFQNSFARTLNLSVHFQNPDGTCLFATVSPQFDAAPGLIRTCLRIPGQFLNDGEVRIKLIVVQDAAAIFILEDVMGFEVTDLQRPEIGTGSGRAPSGPFSPGRSRQTKGLALDCGLIPAPISSEKDRYDCRRAERSRKQRTRRRRRVPAALGLILDAASLVIPEKQH